MAHRRTTTILGRAARGAIAGAAGTWLMDRVTTSLQAAQPAAVTRREERAQPNGRSTVANLVNRIERGVGWSFGRTGRTGMEQAIHYGLGVVPAMAYGVVGRRLPILGWGRGLAFGLLLFALSDEYLSANLGLAGPFRAYPPETHWRGLVGHAVLGVATDTGIDLLGG